MTSSNTQRLLLLTREEKLAAVTGGAIDDSIPELQIIQRLKNEVSRFDTAAILPLIRSQAGRCRGFHIPGKRGPVIPSSLEPAEVIKQAGATCSVIDELRTRLANLHPDIDALANQVIYETRHEFLHDANARMDQDLLRIRAAITSASRTLRKSPSKAGPKHSGWQSARDAIAEALRKYSVPVIASKAATALAVDLLNLCGLKSPRGR